MMQVVACRDTRSPFSVDSDFNVVVGRNQNRDITHLVRVESISIPTTACDQDGVIFYDCFPSQITKKSLLVGNCLAQPGYVAEVMPVDIATAKLRLPTFLPVERTNGCSHWFGPFHLREQALLESYINVDTVQPTDTSARIRLVIELGAALKRNPAPFI